MDTKISDLVAELIRAFYDYLYEKEYQKEYHLTELEKNIAVIRIRTKQIAAQTENMKAYFDSHQQERLRLYQSAEKVLDKALADGDSEYAELACKMITIIRQKNPFAF
ncbi:MAG: hypothetical protein LKE33_07370 [Acidaminococcus sp.]|jgi:hypothetical protein|nr:hypothetical protein [Acidaminococcus sp.]MCI2099829.1 hypothetical protein [Acidaminococcus sp.]MCI2114057.1 hypothetical protein [Acidaminococcus sp.]MCI2115927.1 hypothetical protein [Acidaminococcus sp.]